MRETLSNYSKAGTSLSFLSSRASISLYPPTKSSSIASLITAAAILFVMSLILQFQVNCQFYQTIPSYANTQTVLLLGYLDIGGYIIPFSTSSSLMYAARLQLFRVTMSYPIFTKHETFFSITSLIRVLHRIQLHWSLFRW